MQAFPLISEPEPDSSSIHLGTRTNFPEVPHKDHVITRRLLMNQNEGAYATPKQAIGGDV